jgi:Uma2 family endonuclease
MAIVVLDPDMEERLLTERGNSEGNRYDEVWEGVYMMTPLPNNDHQELVGDLTSILREVLRQSEQGKVFPGVNLSDRAEDWKQNFREPDVAVFLRDGKAVNHGTHWQGAADFLVEIISPGERTREKIPFYSSLGVVELLVIDRDPWALELYRFDHGRLEKIGLSTLAAPGLLQSRTVGLTFRLLAAANEPRPRIEVAHPASGRSWIV